ncbi:hypothetical protein PNP85_12185 [Halobacterium salinarum]|uniref:HVO_A0114 family putative DNA-binding protein n=1 Tax=Halobacterium salinarum TaxID=2242 RepID=UPI0025565296|nr:hypothetical protein [Halobacterium salinarum]MDL0137500.1 hypothetical protein [Halobacterium salinarum]MDL0140260.1 hypothetical protein [Halobacterium salinarum]
MTERTDDGWPETYSDPRNRPHPDVLRITIEDFEATHSTVQAAADTVASGDSQPAVVSFASVAELREILTDRRLEVLDFLLSMDGAADSISALATSLERDYHSVHDDVTKLADYGLVFLIKDGSAKRPYVPYDRIHLDVELVGGSSSEEPAPA